LGPVPVVRPNLPSHAFVRPASHDAGLFFLRLMTPVDTLAWVGEKEKDEMNIRMNRRTRTQTKTNVLPLTAVVALLGASAALADWTNSGGNAGRNGRTSQIGPGTDALLWSGAPSAIISYQPVIEGNRVFLVRQNSFIPNNVPNDSPIVCRELVTGAPCAGWPANGMVVIPYNSGDWTTWIAGVKNGRLYAGRSGNGASVSAKLHCLDAATGAPIWQSQALINAGPYDGVVFAPNGDPIIGNFQSIMRIRATDGSTAWSVPRTCSVSSSCGVAVHGNAVYCIDAVPGGHVVKRFDLDTGAMLYQSPLMSGFTIQNTPMVAPDGTIYVSRTQNNTAVDFFYAIADSGSAMSFKWWIPARWTTSSEFAVGPDGTVYMMAPGNVISRRNPDTGEEINASAPIVLDSPTGNVAPRLATDALGRVYFSNGQFTNGRFYCFNADLTERWSVAVPNINVGAPAIGNDGVLIVAGVGTNVRAYRAAVCLADITGDGTVNVNDLLAVINGWGRCPPPPTACPPDISPPGGDGVVNVNDLLAVINAWGPCP
jgi:outer membrane protein assembly factor BamB